MKKNVWLVTSLALGLSFTTVSCGSDDNESEYTKIANIDYSSANAENWGKYMVQVALRLQQDANDLYDDWSKSYKGGKPYAELFKNPVAEGNTFGKSVEDLIDGCWDIANEVGGAKIGDPYDLYVDGKTEKALYAVESWYSWHSREDYRNNIYSIRNAYYGTRNGSISEKSLSKAIAAVNTALDTEVKNAITNAADKIWAIPAPFRNNIASAEAREASKACQALAEILKSKLKPAAAKLSEEVLKPVVTDYVDVVVLPTYADLKRENTKLYEAVVAFQKAPSQAAMNACAAQWLVAREPWETSEAFLFGPVADRGLDPNMDSWPLDQAGIVQVLERASFGDLDWTGEYDEKDEKIAKKQSLRGFHTLEFLVFKDGKARVIK